MCTTGKTSTLDLFITNDDRLVTSVKALYWLMTSFVRSTGINYNQIHYLKSFLPCSQRLSSRCVNHASLPKPLQLASLDILNLNALGRKKRRLEAYMNALLRSGNTVHANIIKLQLLFIMIYDIKDQVNPN